MRYGKRDWINYERGIEREWLVTNGRSGFAGATITGANSRKYHGLLVACLTSPEERYMILNKLEERIIYKDSSYPLTTTKYQKMIVKGYENQQSFSYDGIPCYRYMINGLVIDKQVALAYRKNTVIIGYDICNNSKPAVLDISPLLTCREPGACSKKVNLTFEKSFIENQQVTEGLNSEIQFVPNYNKELTIRLWSSEGEFREEEQLTEKVFYDVDRTTGDPFTEQLYKPGSYQINIEPYEKKTVYIVCTLEKEKINPEEVLREEKLRISKLRNTFKEDRLIARYLPIAADHFIVERDSIHSKTILAGYPWFLDWGRDTMIAFNGLTLATGRFEDAKEILKSFVLYEKDGLIPNMFPSSKGEPLYNTVDASLWFVHAAYSYLIYSSNRESTDFIEKEIYPYLKKIIKAYKEGTKFSIHMQEDGLIWAGSGLDQVTWMDVRVNDIVVTPRHGKPVEINALWYNALKIMACLEKKFEHQQVEGYEELAEKVKKSFVQAFWNEADGCLFDVVDEKGGDRSIRPNQIWAVSLPFTMLSQEQEKRVVYKVFESLYTPYGLRSLASDHPDYHPIYKGKLFDRDMAYHQGTAWGFPIGAFFTAYCKVNQYSKEALEFVESLISDQEVDLENQCLGTISEIFDGDTPHFARGCYAQAWSVGELLRVYYEDLLGGRIKLEETHKRMFD